MTKKLKTKCRGEMSTHTEEPTLTLQEMYEKLEELMMKWPPSKLRRVSLELLVEGDKKVDQLAVRLQESKSALEQVAKLVQTKSQSIKEELSRRGGEKRTGRRDC
jgi:hypothetical protein